MKSALVLGCSGQDGSYICRSLLTKKFQVLGLTRKKQDLISNHLKLGIQGELEVKYGDINDFKMISNLIEKYQPDFIYNLAAQSSVGESFSAPSRALESTINGTINILEVSRKLEYDGRIFFAGSSEIFGETIKAAKIEHTQKPQSPYGIGKQASMHLVKLYRKIYNLKCVTGVLFNHESPLRNHNFVTQKIIEGALECTRNKSHKIKLGNINIARDWGWAEEYIEAMQIISSAINLKDYVICTGKLTTLKKFIEIVFKELNLNWQEHIDIDKKLFRDNEILQSFGNPNELKNDLGWTAKKDTTKIIRQLIKSKTSDFEMY